MAGQRLRTFASNQRFQAFACYTLAIILSILISIWALKIWRADLHVPFNYYGDALIYGMVIKGTLENGWYLNNPSVGMPAGQTMHEYPLADAFNFLLIKLLGLIRSEYAWVLNVFFLLTFPLTAVSAVYALRQFNLSCASSIVWGLIYTFLPYHFLRGQGHLFIMTYYVVPLVVLTALWICTGELLLKSGKQNRWGFLRQPKFILAVIFCALTSSVGLGYYAFFSCFFVLMAGVIASVCHRSMRHLLTPAILIAIIFTGLLANLAPNLVYIYKHGSTNVAQRSPHEAEVYGLKIAQLLLPINGHRITPLTNLKEKYNYGPLMNENSAAALGFIGSAGFLILLGWLFFKKPDAAHMKFNGTKGLLSHLSLLNISAVLLGTIGGFSSIFALLITPQIRTYNRISIFIGFFCLLAVALLLEDFFRRRIEAGTPRAAIYALLAVILVVGVLDQTSKGFVPNYAYNARDFQNDREFVAEIESSLPKGAMIFQLPYVPFPEQTAVNDMTDYELFRGYLHSKNLRWSYGGMKGRRNDLWQEAITSRPLDQMLENIAIAGFEGIYLDRKGFADEGKIIEGSLSELIGAPPIRSSNGRQLFFSLTQFANSLRAKYSEEEWKTKVDGVMNPLLITWNGGFSGLEGTEANNWRWCSSDGELHLDNGSEQEREISLEMVLISGSEANMRISSPASTDLLKVSSEGSNYSKTIKVPPGRFTFQFHCDGKRIEAPLDSRFLVFKVANFKWKNAN